MSRDTFDMFAPPERGRFGDNESVRGNESGRSDLIDCAMVLHVERPMAALVSRAGDIASALWLPKSQIELILTGPPERKRNGRTVQPCTVTMPAWLAKDKGLV